MAVMKFYKSILMELIDQLEDEMHELISAKSLDEMLDDPEIAAYDQAIYDLQKLAGE